ncbi:MAG: prepilin-type N-terminal cleavage/methylation domain-containing protein [Candidatus Eremiobacteraeota bacterium]|nr:prepilin-type N-terminal cleavage/methylation domain-containing protein [Candidatus Eremiobacteraeota bacterium]MCW5871143.1 prepilin-type N-terminal cleavage/methylation domain-containing protein [Candidatus Eremiobacteraeota bacterium]
MRKSGFSLLETLITIALVSLVFGMFMMLLRDSFTITRRMASKDEHRRAAQVALDRMLTEAREADTIQSPAVSDDYTFQLQLSKVHEQDAVRCPAPLSYPIPDTNPPGAIALPVPSANAAFEPFKNDYRRKVLYHLESDGNLVREAGPFSGSLGDPLVLGTGLTGLRCEWDKDTPLASQELLKITLTYQEGNNPRPIVGLVHCPGVKRN